VSGQVFDLVVIGAGVAGASVGQRAAQLGLSTAIIDAGRPGRATTAGAGIISNYGLSEGELSPAWLSLVRSSTAEYGALMSRLGEGADRRSDYRVVGEVVLATTDEEGRELDRFQSALASLPHGPDRPEVRRLGGRELRSHWPSIRDDLDGLFISTTARVDGNLLADLLLERARAHGAVVLRGAAEFGDASGRRVHVNGEVVSAGRVVVAAGVWTPEVVKSLGVRMSVVADRGQIVHLSGEPQVEHAPVLKTFDGPYVLGFQGPRIVVGATHETTAAPSSDVRAGDQHEILERAFSVAPRLRSHSILETRVGFRPTSLDGLPLVGAVSENVSVLTGLGSWGLTLGPLLGRRLVDQLSGVEEREALDISFLSPQRMEAVAPTG